jgi:iron complex outermembrane receptor protein
MMNTFSYKKDSLLLMVCIFGFAHFVYAAESGDVIKLDEVVVTATRTRISLADAPAAVTVVTDKQIESKSVSRLGDALTNVPSLFLRAGALGDSQGTQGTSGMSLRGVDHKKVLILLDGQPIQDAGSGQINWRTAFVDDIARIEVVPGAFSSLYGSNAIGGVINIISKQPDKRELSAKVKKGWNDASGEEASLYFRDKNEKGWGIVAGLGYQNRDSYVNDFVVRTPSAGAAGTPVTGAQPTTSSTGAPAYIVGDKGAAPWHQLNATSKLYYDLSAVDKLSAGVSFSRTDLGYTHFNSYLRNASTGAPVASGTLGINGQRVTLLESNFVNNSPLLESSTRYFAAYEGVIGEDKILKVDLARINRQYQFVNADSTATWDAGTGTQSTAPNSGTDANLSVSFPLGNMQTIVSGVALHREVVDGLTYNLANWRDPETRTTLASGFTGDSTTTSVYAQDEVAVGGKLKVYAGGRYDSWQTQGSYFKSVTTAPATPAVSASYEARSSSAFNAKLAGVYRAMEGVTLRASYGQSFRAPTNQDLYAYSSIAGVTSINDPNLKPEQGRSWELGTAWQVSENLKTSATYYQTMIQDLITNKRLAPPPNIVSQRINAGRARISGIELSAESVLNSWLEMSASLAFIESEMLENEADPGSVGKRLIDSPKNIFSMLFTAHQGSWSGTLSANYYSKIYSTAQNTDTVEGVPGAYDPRTLLNAKIMYAFSNEIKGHVAINNLLDEKSYSFFLNPGRSLMAGVDFSL